MSIPDAKLRAAIAMELGKASGATITQGDMTRLTGLNAPGANIRDVTGLEFATNLTRLNLGEQRHFGYIAAAGLDQPGISEPWEQRHFGYIAAAGLDQPKRAGS